MNQVNVEIALMIKHLTAPDAVIGLNYAGIPAYFAHRPAVDMLGKSDRHIAHIPARLSHGGVGSSLVEFLPGHNKWDMVHVIDKHKPDVMLSLWSKQIEDIPAPLLDDYEYVVFLNQRILIRRESPRVGRLLNEMRRQQQ